MTQDHIFISRKGYQKIMTEIETLRAKRPKIALDIKEALEKGDLKENAEYHAAKEDLAHVQRRIAELEGKISTARLIEDQPDIPADKAYIGATVTVTDDTGTEAAYTLADTSEADPTAGIISVTSPIGQSLLGHGVGDSVTVPIGKNGYTLRITKITRD